MAYQYLGGSSGQSVTTGADAIYRLKEFLKAAGFTVPRSSDGTTYNASGDQISSSGTGAGGLNNANAWFVLRQPASYRGLQREYCFQRGSTHLLWRITFAVLGDFTSGPTATQAPNSASNTRNHIFGSGTEAVPTFASLFPAFASGETIRACVDNASPYGWWLAFYSSGLQTLLAVDPVVPGTANNRVGTAYRDADPYAYVCQISSPGDVFSTAKYLVGDSAAQGYLGFDEGDAAPGVAEWVPLSQPMLAVYDAVNGTRPAIPRNTTITVSNTAWSASAIQVAVPVQYVRPAYEAGLAGRKGTSTFFRHYSNSSPPGFPSRLGGSTYDHIAFRHLIAPWGGGGSGTIEQFEDLAGAVGSDATAPVVTVVSPPAGTEIDATEPVVVDVTDEASLRRAIVHVQLPQLGLWEVAHDGDSFAPLYSAGSTRAAISGGYRYTLNRATGWPSRTVTVQVFAVDTGGNEGA
jgi:hypothetical protein